MSKIHARHHVRRIKERARYERADAYAILDAGFIAHVAFSVDGQPFAIPMLYARREDKLLLPLVIGSIVLGAVLAFVIGLFFGMQWVLLPLGIAVGVLGAVTIFGRRVQTSVYAKADGQPGAAGWALDLPGRDNESEAAGKSAWRTGSH